MKHALLETITSGGGQAPRAAREILKDHKMFPKGSLTQAIQLANRYRRDKIEEMIAKSLPLFEKMRWLIS